MRNPSLLLIYLYKCFHIASHVPAIGSCRVEQQRSREVWSCRTYPELAKNSSSGVKLLCLVTGEPFPSSRCFGFSKQVKPKAFQEVNEVFAAQFALKSKGATQLNLGQELEYEAFHNYYIYWFGERYETLFGWAWASPTKKNNYRLWAGKQWGLQGCFWLCLHVGQTSQPFGEHRQLNSDSIKCRMRSQLPKSHLSLPKHCAKPSNSQKRI